MPQNESRVCCNKCHPEIVMVPKYKYKLRIVEVPVPVFIPPSDVVDKCPEGFQQVGRDKCVKKITHHGACPPGWVRVDDDTCLRVLRIDTDPECPRGFVKMSDGKCHKWTEEVVEVLKCPQGWRQVSPYRCVRIVSCPKRAGYRVSRKFGCVHTPVRCPRGYKRIGRNRCILIEVNCPPGFRFVRRKRACVKIVTEFTCPKGYRLIKGTKKCVLRHCYKVKCARVKRPRACPQGHVWKIVRGECCPRCAPCQCPMDWRAVCSNDGTTFPNECTARCLGATIKKHHPCHIDDQPPRDTCPIKWDRNVECEKKCLDEKFAPVCTASGVTLPSECVANCFSETVAYKGKCKPICETPPPPPVEKPIEKPTETPALVPK